MLKVFSETYSDEISMLSHLKKSPYISVYINQDENIKINNRMDVNNIRFNL